MAIGAPCAAVETSGYEYGTSGTLHVLTWQPLSTQWLPNTQSPQATAPPQLLLRSPHWPKEHVVIGWQSQVPETLLLQRWWAGHESPQANWPMQPSLMLPQSTLALHTTPLLHSHPFETHLRNPRDGRVYTLPVRSRPGTLLSSVEASLPACCGLTTGWTGSRRSRPLSRARSRCQPRRTRRPRIQTTGCMAAPAPAPALRKSTRVRRQHGMRLERVSNSPGARHAPGSGSGSGPGSGSGSGSGNGAQLMPSPVYPDGHEAQLNPVAGAAASVHTTPAKHGI